MRKRQGAKVLAGYRLWVESQGLAKGTVRNYLISAKGWLNWCEENEVSALNPSRDDVRIWAGEMLASHKQSTFQLRRTCLKVFYDFLAQEFGYKGPNPVIYLPFKKAAPPPVEPFTKEELGRMLMACQNHQERAVFLLLVGGGLRRSEIYGIKREDVNENSRTIRVFGKGAKYRTIKPGQVVIDAVLGAMEFSERLCPQAADDVVWRIVHRIAKRSGVKGRIHPHRFRHNYAVTYLEAGGRVQDLQHILGHERVDMSLFYARAGEKQRAIEAQETVNVTAQLLGLSACKNLLEASG